LLTKFDPQYNQSIAPNTSQKQWQETDFQVHLAVERIRVPEILFQPYFIGIDQMGIVEASYHLLSQFSQAQQTALVKVSAVNRRFDFLRTSF
jgi:actin-related protein 5